MFSSIPYWSMWQVLIDLVDYYCRMGTKLDPGITTLENVVQRASKALEQHAKGQKEEATKAVDPFQPYDEYPDVVMKMEEDLF